MPLFLDNKVAKDLSPDDQVKQYKTNINFYDSHTEFIEPEFIPEFLCFLCINLLSSLSLEKGLVERNFDRRVTQTAALCVCCQQTECLDSHT